MYVCIDFSARRPNHTRFDKTTVRCACCGGAGGGRSSNIDSILRCCCCSGGGSDSSSNASISLRYACCGVGGVSGGNCCRPLLFVMCLFLTVCYCLLLLLPASSYFLLSESAKEFLTIAATGAGTPKTGTYKCCKGSAVVLQLWLVSALLLACFCLV